jgi:hypothetical protein
LYLDPDDIARITEFLDCDTAAALDFIRKVWLPDVRESSKRIMRAVLRRDWHSLAFLCDHVREGARCVGASRVVRCTDELDVAISAKDVGAARDSVSAIRTSLCVLEHVLTSYTWSSATNASG